MNIDLFIESETEGERQFAEQLAEVRDMGLEVGLSEEEVARVFVVYAQGLLSNDFENRVQDTSNEENALCPECGSLIEGVEVKGIGEIPIIQPCGCEVEFNELPEEIRQDMLG